MNDIPVEPPTRPRLLVIRHRRCACGRTALPAAEHLGLCAPCSRGEEPVDPREYIS